MPEEGDMEKENLRRFTAAPDIPIDALMKRFEAVFPTNWQEILALTMTPRMLLASK